MPADPSAAIEGVQQALDEWKVKVDAQVQEDIDARTRPVRWLAVVVALLAAVILAGGATISYLFVDLSGTQADATTAIHQIKTVAVSASFDACQRGNEVRDGILHFLDQTLLELSGVPSDQVVNATPAQLEAMIARLPANSQTAIREDDTIFADLNCTQISTGALP